MSEANLGLNEAISEYVMLPIFLSFLEERAGEKSFNPEYPRETLQILLPGLAKFWYEVNPASDPDRFRERIRISLTVLEKALGAPKGSLQIFPE